MKGNQISACLASFTFNNSSGAGLCVRTALFRSSIECFSTAILSKSCRIDPTHRMGSVRTDTPFRNSKRTKIFVWYVNRSMHYPTSQTEDVRSSEALCTFHFSNCIKFVGFKFACICSPLIATILRHFWTASNLCNSAAECEDLNSLWFTRQRLKFVLCPSCELCK